MSAPENTHRAAQRETLDLCDHRGHVEMGESSVVLLSMVELWTHVSLFGLAQKDGLTRANMKSAAKPWNPVIKAGGHGADRARPLPAASSGMKSSKSSTSLAFESRLSKVQTKMPSTRLLGAPGSPGRGD